MSRIKANLYTNQGKGILHTVRHIPRRVANLFVIGLFLFVTACNGKDVSNSPNWPLACDYASFDVPLQIQETCAQRDADGTLKVNPALLAIIETGSSVESLRVDGQWLFAVHGKAVTALPFDNGPDYFQDGLARIIIEDRIGFVNDTLDIVIKPIWDFAFPFENGSALVCKGCRAVPDGEHQSIEGGLWGYIDPTGSILVKPVYQQDSIPTAPNPNQ